MPHQSRRVFCDETQREINLQHALPQIPHEACVNKKKDAIEFKSKLFGRQIKLLSKQTKENMRHGCHRFLTNSKNRQMILQQRCHKTS
jgi:hypothetical protein